jgi:hypothetical protein
VKLSGAVGQVFVNTSLSERGLNVGFFVTRILAAAAGPNGHLK